MNKFGVILFFIYFCGLITTEAQNLVPNYSFEKKLKCPPDFVSFHREIYVSGWESANTGTPDYFNACANKCGVPNNWVGSSEAYHGKAYVGIIACMQQYDNRQVPYREYIQIQLQEPMKEGRQYYASMQIKLGLTCLCACNGLGILFSGTKLRSDRNSVFPFRSHISLVNEEPIKDKDNWTQVCGHYTATGGELYLIIGNFLSNRQMNYFEYPEHMVLTSTASPMAYYYIDNVELFELNDSVNYDCDNIQGSNLVAFDGSLPEEGKVVLENLYFDFDKAVILPASYAELDQLALLLKAYPAVKIGLYGHTDNLGSSDYNRELSENRANAVKRYLIEKGVSRMRIQCKGYGSTMAVESNENEEGRSLNRRVEFEILNSEIRAY